MIKVAIALLHVSNAASAEQFYCNQLGFCRKFAHRPDGVEADPRYMGVSRDGVWLHLSSFSADGAAGGVAHLIVEGVDALHAEFAAKGVFIDTAPVDLTWGTREMYVQDSDRHCLRFIQS